MMPFEHSVLDCALNEVTARLSREVRELTSRAKPIVDRMASDVARETLLAVRDLKNEQQELHNRVEVVCEQLEALTGARPAPPPLPPTAAVAIWRLCIRHQDAQAWQHLSLNTDPCHSPEECAFSRLLLFEK